MRQIYRVDAAFGQTGRMDAAWNQENADFRQKKCMLSGGKHMVTAVVGANWGDEGKGKITDMLADEADIVIRFQGGANAGHHHCELWQVCTGHTLPSGVFHSHITNIIGNGVALDIPKVIGELKSITDRNVPAPKLMISDRAQMVMPYHVLSDQYEEERLGKNSFGSTKSGIAIAFYLDKYAKIGLCQRAV